MQAPAPHPQEGLRLEALAACRILDTPRELSFDLLAQLAADVARSDVALVSLVDGDRQWFKARIGLDATQTQRRISFCGHAILHDEPLIVEDALHDPRFADNPLVTDHPHIRFYAGFPIKSRSGMPLGTLCVIHPNPKHLSHHQRLLLTRLAQQVELAIELRTRILDTELALEHERDAHRLHTLLCQALIHDMKSPMLVVTLAAEALRAPQRDSGRTETLVGEILAASDTLSRMVLDSLDMVSRGTPTLQPRLERIDLTAIVRRVFDTLTPLFLARRIALKLALPAGPVWAQADPELVRRVLHNLLDNAYKYAAEAGPIEVGLGAAENVATLWVEDRGPGIPEPLREQAFDLYARLDSTARDASRAGHGIGLAFCRLALEAQGGRIGVTEGSDGRGCRFSVELPLSATTT